MDTAVAWPDEREALEDEGWVPVAQDREEEKLFARNWTRKRAIARRHLIERLTPEIDTVRFVIVHRGLLDWRVIPWLSPELDSE